VPRNALRTNPLATLIAVALLQPATVAVAQSTESDPREHEKQFEPITVTASPLARPGDELVKPTATLSGVELEDQRAATIGATVDQETGVQSSYFGPGVGRPIIRGLDGARVSVLTGGLATLDVSTLSVDHAVTIEPFLADQIEIIKGPATLLFGNSAIGGVVNVVDGRIAERPVEGLSGRFDLGGNSVNDARNGMARIDAGNGTLAFHADYLRRDGDDFDGPDDTVIENSELDTRTGAVGVSYTGSGGFAGIALSSYDTQYGIPPEIEEDETDSVRAAKGGGEEKVVLDMEQNRVDAKAGWFDPIDGVERITARLGRNDYEHSEIIADDGEVGTRFENEAWEGRVEAVLAPLGDWRSAAGLQFGRRDFEAIGDEAFVPPTETRDLGVFALTHLENDPYRLEFGARFDRQDTEVVDGDETDHSSFSLSAGGRWDFSERWHASLNLDRAQRAPAAEELFSNGPHEATATFEIGDPGLDEETANQIDLALHYHVGAIEAKLSGFYNRFDDFIYLLDTGAVEDDKPVRQWTQDDARFSGIEAEIESELADTRYGRFEARLFGDLVNGRLDDGGDLPRIAPARFGARLSWTWNAWRAAIGAVRYAEQDDVAAFESTTEAYTLVDAHLSYAFDVDCSEWELYLDGSNLADREARVHTSFLKDRASLPGRAVAFGVRAFFD
jgi:iron complex outermembrane receptor protein